MDAIQEGTGRLATVIRHYATIADGYHQKSAGFPWSIVKNREARTVIRALGPVRGATVLDLGCGIGYFTRLILDAGASDVIAVDACLEMLEHVPRERVRTIHADAAGFSLTEPVQFAVCAGMLEFVDDPRAVLAQAAKAVAPGGALSVLVPGHRLPARIYQRYHRRHGIDVHLFSPARLRSTLEDAGWDVEWIEEVLPIAVVARARRR